MYFHLILEEYDKSLSNKCLLRLMGWSSKEISLEHIATTKIFGKFTRGFALIKTS